MPVNKPIILNQEEDKKKPMEDEISKEPETQLPPDKNILLTADDETPDKLLGDDLAIEKAKNKKEDISDKSEY